MAVHGVSFNVAGLDIEAEMMLVRAGLKEDRACTVGLLQTALEARLCLVPAEE